MDWKSLPEGVRAEYPWPGRFLNLQLDDGRQLRMHYLDEGKGEPLLFVHGNPTWSFYWRKLVGGLSDNYRCIAVDHIGCGLSDKPGKDYSYRLEDHIHNLSYLIEALDLRDVTLVVHDWGGAIGLGTALRHVDRIKRLVIFNTAAFIAPVPAEIRATRWPWVGELVIQGLNGFVRGGFLRATKQRQRFRGAVREGYLAPYDSWDNRYAHLAFIRDIPIEPGHPTKKIIDEIDARLGELSHLPTVFIWGTHDFVFTTAFLERFLVRWPNPEVHLLDQAAHFVVEDAHEQIVPIVRSFLERNAIQAHPTA